MTNYPTDPFTTVTPLNYVKFDDFLISRFKNCEKTGRVFTPQISVKITQLREEYIWAIMSLYKYILLSFIRRERILQIGTTIIVRFNKKVRPFFLFT